MKQTNISLPEELYEKLRLESYRLKVSQAEIVRRALFKYFLEGVNKYGTCRFDK